MREGWWPRAWCGLAASVAAPERAAAEPYLLTPYGWWLRAQVSRDAPPPLPGGYTVGEKVFYTGENFTASNGDKYVHGQQGEVTGPASGENSDELVIVQFPGNKSVSSCWITTVRRLRAASAATPRLRPTHAMLSTPRAFPPQPLPQRPSPHCMSSRSRRSPRMDAEGMVAEGVVRAGRFGGSAREGCGRALPPYSLRLVAACAGEPRCAAAAAGRLQGGREGVLHGGEPHLGRRRQAYSRPAGRGDGGRH
eukprot:scaffold37502_cov51-Phaeocystis_antarctica.AAC.3